MNVSIITPTIGTKHLRKCVESVSNQTYKNFTHYLFIDGSTYSSKIDKDITSNKKIRKVLLEENTGSDGWLGHRIYAAASFLVSGDIICYLDEDNWMEPNHLESLVELIEKGNDWAFSLRKIFTQDGVFVCEDNCESLGKWPVYTNEKVFHIDTSCFALKMDVALKIGHTWYKKWDADRQFFTNLKHYFSNFDCTGDYTLSYRLGGNQNSVKKEFFEKGNAIHKRKYDNFPWKR